MLVVLLMLGGLIELSSIVFIFSRDSSLDYGRALLLGLNK